MTKKIRICAYCGMPGATTRDHVIPETLFLKPRPSNLITVPACISCNSEIKAQDDPYLRDFLYSNWEAQGHPTSPEMLQAIFSSIHRNSSEFAADVRRTRSHWLYVYTQSLPHSGYGIGATVPLDRVRRMMFTIARGLYFHEMHVELPPYPELEYGLARERDLDEAARRCRSLIAAGGYVRQIGDGQTFFYVYGLEPNEPYNTLWYLWFLRNIVFVVFTSIAK